MSARDMLAAVVPEGKANAISRRKLADRLNMGDRHVREVVNAARREGLAVLNDQDGKGYYLCTDGDEFKRWAKQEWARAQSIIAPISAIGENFKEADNGR